MSGFTGISFPFKISNKGGVLLSSTDKYNVQHIIESIHQILGTRIGERTMELNFGSDLDTQIFEPNDPTTHNLIAYEIVEALERWEKRIVVKKKDITFTVEGEKIYATVRFEVVNYGTSHTTQVEIGGVDNG